MTFVCTYSSVQDSKVTGARMILLLAVILQTVTLIASQNEVKRFWLGSLSVIRRAVGQASRPDLLYLLLKNKSSVTFYHPEAFL